MAERIDLPAFVRGDTWTNRVVLTSKEGDFIDVTGYQFWLTLKLDPTAADSAAAGQTSVEASGPSALVGEAYLTLPAEVTAELLPTRYSYDVQMVGPGGVVQTLFYGRVGVIADITRSSV